MALTRPTLLRRWRHNGSHFPANIIANLSTGGKRDPISYEIDFQNKATERCRWSGSSSGPAERGLVGSCCLPGKPIDPSSAYLHKHPHPHPHPAFCCIEITFSKDLAECKCHRLPPTPPWPPREPSREPGVGPGADRLLLLIQARTRPAHNTPTRPSLAFCWAPRQLLPPVQDLHKLLV